jgi:hypothetical protein
MKQNNKYTEIMKQLNYQPIGSVLLRLCGVVKRLWNKLTIIIIYLPSVLIDYLISLTTDESYKEARKTTMRSFKRVWHNK